MDGSIRSPSLGRGMRTHVIVCGSANSRGEVMESWELDVRESVRQTLSDYTAATDRFDLPALAVCFAASGVLEFHGGDQPLVGPAAIEHGLRAAMSGAADSDRRAPTHVRHHVASVRFGTVVEDRVEVSSYFAVY